MSSGIPRTLGREVRLWAAQRLTAAVLAFCVVVHIVTMVLAVQGGLSAAEILARTRGNAAWAAFYSVFVLAASLHTAIGLRTIAAEWAGWRGDTAEVAITVFGGVLAVLGLRAVAAVYGAGG